MGIGRGILLLFTLLGVHLLCTRSTALRRTGTFLRYVIIILVLVIIIKFILVFIFILVFVVELFCVVLKSLTSEVINCMRNDLQKASYE